MIILQNVLEQINWGLMLPQNKRCRVCGSLMPCTLPQQNHLCPLEEVKGRGSEFRFQLQNRKENRNRDQYY